MNPSIDPRAGVEALSPVARTLLVPLWARAEESRLRDPALYDASADDIVRGLGVDLSRLDEARASQLGCSVRGALVDAWTRAFLHEHPEGTVVELGVGLNSRQARLDDGRARWVDVDLPEVMALRRRFIPARANRVEVAGSITDLETLQAVRDAVRGPCLIVSEGVLVYLTRDEVRALLARLRALLPGAVMALDVMTHPVIRWQGAHDAMRHFEARFTWGVREPREVLTYAEGLHLEAMESFYDLLYARASRLPRWMRVAGPIVRRAWPGVRWCYAILRVRLGPPGG
ncbi:MAG: class I SAM-dependent methyltransferase [Polyangiales bacterium]